MESTDSLLLSVDLFIFIPSSNQYGNQSISTILLLCYVNMEHKNTAPLHFPGWYKLNYEDHKLK